MQRSKVTPIHCSLAKVPIRKGAGERLLRISVESFVSPSFAATDGSSTIKRFQPKPIAVFQYKSGFKRIARLVAVTLWERFDR